MKKLATIVLATLLALASTAPMVDARSLPEEPAVMWNVSLVEGDENGEPQAKHPAIPPLRTSSDGRIGWNIKSNRLFLIVPEKMTAPFLESEDGVQILSSTTGQEVPSLPPEGLNTHPTICDPGLNPQPCDGDNVLGEGPFDCYTFKIITPEKYPTMFRLHSTTVTVRVENPKSAEASIADVTTGTSVAGPVLGLNGMFETTITADGKLIVGRAGITGVDIMYAVADEAAAPCDVSEWTAFHSITHAPHDDDMIGRYGIAAYKFQDSEGNEIQDGVDLNGTYPWIDREGNNLFFASVFASLWYVNVDTGELETRYPASCVPGVECEPVTPSTIKFYDSRFETSGTSVAGLWTHGKVVLLDGIINHLDYGLRMPDNKQRMIALYEPGSGPQGTETGEVRIGSGRQNGDLSIFPPGFVNNSTFIDSPQQLLNANPMMEPLTVRDVVWIVNTGHSSDEVAFDDYLDPDGFVFSEMTASLTWEGSLLSFPGAFDYHDGFAYTGECCYVGEGFTREVHMQNAATSTVWDIPDFGRVYGNGRVEPVALGGIRGKGLWLDGETGVAYEVPDQPQDVHARSWYTGIFLDPRFDHDEVTRNVIRFPDGSRLVLVGQKFIDFVGPEGSVYEHYEVDTLSQTNAWMHLGLVVTHSGRRVELYVNGKRTETWSSMTRKLFRMADDAGKGGTLHVGHVEGESGAEGFRGWIDELKIVARKPSAEVLCNHARGTLIKSLYSSRGQVPTCFHDYTARQPAAHLKNLPPGTYSVREELLFPEGPLVYDQPRPDSSGNAFCLTCHVSSAVSETLQPAALEYHPGDLLQHDPRRQPRQPPALIFGNIPADLYGPGLPPADDVAPAEGAEQDQWVYPAP